MNSVFVRPDVQAFLDYVNTARPAKHFELGPEKARTIMRDMRVLADVPVGELAVEQDLHCPGPGGELRLRLFDAREMRAPGPAVGFFHGGGFVLGDLDTPAPFCAEAARQPEFPAIAVDSRLARSEAHTPDLQPIRRLPSAVICPL